MRITKEYLEKGGLTLSIQFYYSMGGMNYFTNTTESRGYYLSVSPVSVSRDENGRVRSESYSAFSGIKDCLLEVKRKSPKAQAEAEKLIEAKRKELISYIMKKNNIPEEETA